MAKKINTQEDVDTLKELLEEEDKKLKNLEIKEAAQQNEEALQEWPPLSLGWHEDVAGAGQGHLLAKHVGVSNDYLINRDGDATRWKNRLTAQSTVIALLNGNKTKINNWFQKKPTQNKLALSYSGSSPVGEGVRDGFTQLEDCPNARVILKRGGPKGWYIVTGYPEW